MVISLSVGAVIIKASIVTDMITSLLDVVL